MPHTQVGPAEVAVHHIHLIITVEQSWVDRHIGIRREFLLDIQQLLIQRNLFAVLNLQQHLGEDMVKAVTHVLHVRQVDTRIP